MRQRRFLIPSSFARLIRREQAVIERVVEGYFPARSDREHFISIEPGHSYLVLAVAAQGAVAEERTEVPRSQAEALMEVCVGRVGYERTTVQLPDGKEGVLDRFIVPGLLDVLTVEFAQEEGTDAFTLPAWFGPEVTDTDAYS